MIESNINRLKWFRENATKEKAEEAKMILNMFGYESLLTFIEDYKGNNLWKE